MPNKKCEECGKVGRLGNSILPVGHGKERRYVCWECSATPAHKKQQEKKREIP